MDFNRYKDILRQRLDDYRYNHSLCVADEAARLAAQYGENIDEAYLAGLLHDITKNDSAEEHLHNFERFGIILTDLEKVSPKLWHAISGSAYIRNVLNIKNDKIVSAVRYHTTAKRDMCLFDKLIYLADFTSADRNYTDVEIMRNLTNNNINDALLYALKYTITSLAGKNMPIHPDAIEAYNQIITKNIKEEIVSETRKDN